MLPRFAIQRRKSVVRAREEKRGLKAEDHQRGWRRRAAGCLWKSGRRRRGGQLLAQGILQLLRIASVAGHRCQVYDAGPDQFGDLSIEVLHAF